MKAKPAKKTPAKSIKKAKSKKATPKVVKRRVVPFDLERYIKENDLLRSRLGLKLKKMVLPDGSVLLGYDPRRTDLFTRFLTVHPGILLVWHVQQTGHSMLYAVKDFESIRLEGDDDKKIATLENFCQN